MKNLGCYLLSIFLTLSASAQKVYFIYLQTEDYSAFYAKLNDKIYSSSNAGYLILPNLKDSTYNFSIGFPSSQTDSKFTVAIAGKDRGFLIKNFDSGLGLFDLQNLSVIRAQKEEKDKTISYQRRNDEFSSLLSKAANDTSLLYAVIRQDVALQQVPPAVKEAQSDPAAVQVKEEAKKDTPVTSLQTDIALNNKSDSNGGGSAIQTVSSISSNEEIKNQKKTADEDSLKNLAAVRTEENKTQVSGIDSAAIVTPEIYVRSVIKKHSESSTSEGFGLVFYDRYDQGVDTIRLIIPNPKIVLRQFEADSSEKTNEFIHVNEIKQDSLTQIPVVVSNKPKVVISANCKAVASNNDFLKLRKNMAAKETDEGMVDEAKKYFRNRCFTTEQVKNLSALFLTSAGKYQFFDAAYLHVTDQEQFTSLESEIRDDYYLKRFKALVDK